MLSTLDGFDNVHEQRLDALDDLVRDCLQVNQRVVVFVTAPSFADEVNTYLEDLHTEPVFRHSSENERLG